MSREELVQDFLTRMSSEGGSEFDPDYFKKRYPGVDPEPTLELGKRLSEAGLDVRYVYHPLFKMMDGQAHQIKSRTCSGLEGALKIILREKKSTVFLLSLDDGMVRYCSL